MPIITEVNYDHAKVRFRVTCPSWEIGKGQSFPKRKWNKDERYWEFPVTPHVVNLLNEAWPDAVWSKDSEKIARKALEARTLLVPADRTPFPANYKFKLTPMPHQKLGLDYIYSIDRAALFCEMRTGKTKIAIDDAVQKFLEKKLQRVLIFAPNNLLLNWLDELKKNVPIPYAAHALRLSHWREAIEFIEDQGPQGLRGMIFGIVSYESLSSTSVRAFEWSRKFIDHRPVGIICDESHWLKNPKAQRTKRVEELSKDSVRRRLLTGTEITKDLEDLYAQFGILRDILTVDSFFAYRNRYCVMGGHGGKEIIGYRNTNELFQTIRPFCFQVKRQDVEKDLPAKMSQKIMVEMTAEQEKEYRKMDRATVDANSMPMNTLTKYLRLHQIAGGFINEGSPEFDDNKGGKSSGPEERWISDSKLNAMMEFIEPVEGSIVIWARYKIEIQKIVKTIGEECFVLTGDTPKEERHQMVKAFQRKEKRFIIGNTKTGGVGIDLSAADTVVFYSSTFDYAEQVQAEDRVQNLARKKAVLYGYLISADTVDEIIMEALESKQSLAEYLKGEIKKR